MNFYRNMSEGELRAYLRQILANLEAEIMIDDMKQELKKILEVFKEKGLDPDDSSLSSKLETLRFYINEMTKRGEL